MMGITLQILDQFADTGTSLCIRRCFRQGLTRLSAGRSSNIYTRRVTSQIWPQNDPRWLKFLLLVIREHCLIGEPAKSLVIDSKDFRRDYEDNVDVLK